MAKWIVPDDAPTGIVRYTVTAKDPQGRTGEFKPFDVEASQITIVATSATDSPSAKHESLSVLPFWILLALLSALSACSRFQLADFSSTWSLLQLRHPVQRGYLTRTRLRQACCGWRRRACDAEGLPPGKTVDLTWGTVTGGWVIEDYYHFRGKKYSETHQQARSSSPSIRTGGSTRASRFPRTTAVCTK